MISQKLLIYSHWRRKSFSACFKLIKFIEIDQLLLRGICLWTHHFAHPPTHVHLCPLGRPPSRPPFPILRIFSYDLPTYSSHECCERPLDLLQSGLSLKRQPCKKGRLLGCQSHVHTARAGDDGLCRQYSLIQSLEIPTCLT